MNTTLLMYLNPFFFSSFLSQDFRKCSTYKEHPSSGQWEHQEKLCQDKMEGMWWLTRNVGFPLSIYGKGASLGLGLEPRPLIQVSGYPSFRPEAKLGFYFKGEGALELSKKVCSSLGQKLEREEQKENESGISLCTVCWSYRLGF